jgi:PPOX class probable F420-dependent enzyme
MRLAADEAWRRLAESRSAVLVTIRPDGSPAPVPFVFAPLDGARLVSAVDAKPKSTRQLARLEHIQRDPRVTVLVDHYDDDWDRLWWVRGDGAASVERSAPAGAEALNERYAAYRAAPPAGPWIVIDLEEVTGWTAH